MCDTKFIKSYLDYLSAVQIIMVTDTDILINDIRFNAAEVGLAKASWWVSWVEATFI